MMHNLIKITEFADLTRRIEVLEQHQLEARTKRKRKSESESSTNTDFRPCS